MKCSACVIQGKRSKVFVHGSSTTLLNWFPYYDEDGNLHDNNPNKVTTSYSCSNGHMWEEITGGLDKEGIG